MIADTRELARIHQAVRIEFASCAEELGRERLLVAEAHRILVRIGDRHAKCTYDVMNFVDALGRRVADQRQCAACREARGIANELEVQHHLRMQRVVHLTHLLDVLGGTEPQLSERERRIDLERVQRRVIPRVFDQRLRHLDKLGRRLVIREASAPLRDEMPERLH